MTTSIPQVLIRVAASLIAGVVLLGPALGLTQPAVLAPAQPKITQPDLSKATPQRVVKVVDTNIVVVSEGGKDVFLRLIGVGTPEKSDPRKALDGLAAQAAEFAANLLKGESVYILESEHPGKADPYGRKLAYVYRAPDGLFVNAEIVRQGYAPALSDHPFKFMEQFREYEKNAREAKKGLWSDKTTTPATPAIVPTPTPAPQPNPPKALERQEPKPEVKQVTVYGTRTGSKYHSAGCRYLSKSSVPMNLEDAKRRGLGPCSRCHPPQ